MLNKLDSLPPSDDEYFTKYEADTKKIVLPKIQECKHYFVRKSGTETECQKCGAGFYLTPEFNVKEGHIFKEDQFVI